MTKTKIVTQRIKQSARIANIKIVNHSNEMIDDDDDDEIVVLSLSESEHAKYEFH